MCRWLPLRGSSAALERSERKPRHARQTTAGLSLPHRLAERLQQLGTSNEEAAPRLKARPQAPQAPTRFRVRRDRVDSSGRVTLRYLSWLHHIAIGRAHKNRRVRLLIADAEVHVIDDDGVLLRQLTLDPKRDYQPLGKTYTVRDVLRQVSGMS